MTTGILFLLESKTTEYDKPAGNMGFAAMLAEE